MIPVIICAIAGISGIEGIFFAKQSAELKGFEVGNNYLRQPAIALPSYSATAFIFFFSGINHGVDAIKRKNYKWQNSTQPF